MVFGYRAVAPDFGASAPRAGPARVLSVNKNRYLKYRYIKTGINNRSYIKIRYIIHVSGSNTPMGRWPGEFLLIKHLLIKLELFDNMFD